MVDALFAVAYCIRAVLFYSSCTSRVSISSYYKAHLYTLPVLALASVVNVSMLWAEWQTFPVWPFVNCCILLPLCNLATTFTLRGSAQETLREVKEAEYLYQSPGVSKDSL